MLVYANDTRIHYDLVGPTKGEVVCLAHALLADGGMWSQQVAPLVGAGFRVLRVDMRGHGGSDASGDPCTVSDLARDILVVLDHLMLESVHFVGLSIGGIVGQELGIHHGERLLSLTLSDTNSATVEGAKAMWDERVATIRKAGSTVPLAAGMMSRLLTEGFRQGNPDLWAATQATIECTRPEGVYACAHALQNFDFQDSLGTVTTPTLVLCGSDDPATPPSEARKIAGLIPDARYEEIPDALHFANVEQGEYYSKVLLTWLRSVG